MAFNELLVQIDFLGVFLVLVALLNGISDLLFLCLKNFGGLGPLDLFFSLALCEAFDLDLVVVSIELVDFKG